MDGNVKPQNPDGTFKDNGYHQGTPETVEHPGYTDTWKKAVVDHNGSFLKVPASDEEE